MLTTAVSPAREPRYPGQNEGPAAGPCVFSPGAGGQGVHQLTPVQQTAQGFPLHHLWSPRGQSCQVHCLIP